MPVPVSTSPWGNGPSGARGFTAFDYNKAYGKNPFADYTGQLKDLVGSLIDPIKSLFGAGGDGSSSFFGGGTHVARPDDPEVAQYMSHIMGGQRNTLDDLMKRAAATGINRRGQNVRGGPGYESGMYQDAMRTLAGGYQNRFESAMDYNKYLQGTLADLESQRFSDAMRLLDMQRAGLRDYGDWQSQMGDRMRGDYQSDIGYMRGAPMRQLQEEQARRQDLQSRQMWERQQQEYQNKRNLWRQAFGPGYGTVGMSPNAIAGQKLQSISNPVWGYQMPRPGEAQLASTMAAQMGMSGGGQSAVNKSQQYNRALAERRRKGLSSGGWGTTWAGKPGQSRVVGRF
jgi:hypothetical protein